MSPTYVITGPTRGLGRALALDLSARPDAPNLVLVGRPGAALDDVAGAARRQGGAEVFTVPCDLSSLAQVGAAVAQVEGELEFAGLQLDGLVANAALQMLNANTATVDGFETTFAIGLLAHHLMLRCLEHRFAAGARVVFIGSGTHYGTFPATVLVPGPAWRDPQVLLRPWTDPDAGSVKAGQRVYSTSKLGVNYLAHEWTRRRPDLRVNVYDPGLMPGTGLVRGGAKWRAAAWNRVMPALRVLPGVTSPVNSARHLAELLTGSAHAQLHGGYIEIGKVKDPSAESFDPGRERQLWEACEGMVGLTASG